MKVSGKGSNPMSVIDAPKTTSLNAELAAKKKQSRAIGFDDIAGSSKVDISERAQDINKAKELAMAKDDIDEAKVARLQKLIDDGNYKVDSEAVADRMVDEHFNMPS